MGRKERLLSKLDRVTKRPKAVMLPHFCLDSSIKFDHGLKELEKNMEDIAEKGGGNIRVQHSLSEGGKAVNCAFALSSLGVSTSLIARTDVTGFKLLERFTDDLDLDLSRVRTDGRLAVSTVLELKEDGESINLMLSDPGSLSDFGPEKLEREDESMIKKADIVCLSDWGLNEKGTELAREVFSLAKEHDCKTFFDPGDPSPQKEGIDELRQKVLFSDLIDILSVNEDELLTYAGKDELEEAKGTLLDGTQRVDLHTADHSRSFYSNGSTEKVPSFKVNIERSTGAGDSWNAGDILGELSCMSAEDRLLLSNAVAGYYISEPEMSYPSKDTLKRFIKSTSLREI